MAQGAGTINNFMQHGLDIESGGDAKHGRTQRGHAFLEHRYLALAGKLLRTMHGTSSGTEIDYKGSKLALQLTVNLRNERL